MRPRYYIFIFFTLIAFVASAFDTDIYIQGKRGKELATSIHNHFRPHRLVKGLYGNGGAWEAFRMTDKDTDGFIIDRYSSLRRNFDSDGISPTEGMTTDCIVNTSWWKKNNIYDDTISLDLFNLIPCEISVPVHKKNYPPGIVTHATYDNSFWKAGSGYIGGIEVNFYEPADEYKGDFARAILYMAVMYPCEFWSNLGENFFDDNSFPTLNKYALNLLLSWSEKDPVSEIEIGRNNAVEKIQGNRNPFVDYPQLIYHIWDNNPQPFIIEDSPIPLKARYQISEEKIYLVSPHIPAKAQWFIDGKEIIELSVSPKSLGIGKHIFRFKSDKISGKILIEITP